MARPCSRGLLLRIHRLLSRRKAQGSAAKLLGPFCGMVPLADGVAGGWWERFRNPPWVSRPWIRLIPSDSVPDPEGHRMPSPIRLVESSSASDRIDAARAFI